MLGLGYPGGAVIDRIAKTGDPQQIVFPRSYLDKSRFDFSFSGIKTSVNRYIQTHTEEYKQHIPDIVAGFQEAVVEVLSYKLLQAALSRKCNHIALVGGVAANTCLRERLVQIANQNRLQLHIPSFDLCGDNAAMIAATGYHYLKAGKTANYNDDVFSSIKTQK
jgi:N6-L-threonylcarbamoyladenine synthase